MKQYDSFKRIVFILLLLLGLTCGSVSAQFPTDTTSWETLRNRPYPQWFTDAKLGVFIHWGIYSVPAYGGKESYGEWYLRGLQVGDSNRTKFMKKYWGEDFSYEDFAPLFKAELFDADEWASIFKSAGARYIVLVSKHHDGYCLWPSQYAPNWNSVDVGPKRDILSELKTAVEQQDLRFGIYYSLAEWNNPLHYWYQDPHDSIGKYVETYMIPQFEEVITAYRPEVLFTDGEWFNTAEQWHARQLIAWYYDLVGEGAIVNDRWGSGADIGFKTPEYSSGGLLTDRPWAEVRGLGRSFGLNRYEKLSAYMTSQELIQLFARCVAHGGGLIINIGPAADGKIPLLQQERLEDLGEWIAINEEAIYAASAWTKSEEYKDVYLERIDSCIHFNWVRNSPGYPIAEDHFTATWTGYIMSDYTGVHTFSATTDDAMRLYIDGKLILDLWNEAIDDVDSEAMREKAGKLHQGTIKMEKGKKYPIRIEYREDIRNAFISLFWESKFHGKEIVPARNLYTGTEPAAKNGLSAVYKSEKQYIAYTQNEGNLYAICFEWPDHFLELPIPEPEKGTSISLLGRKGNIPWKYKDGKLLIDVSGISYNEIPNHNAWTFKIENYTK